MNTWSSRDAELTRDRMGNTIGNGGVIDKITIPARVTIRVVAICLAMILAEDYDVAIYGAVLVVP